MSASFLSVEDFLPKEDLDKCMEEIQWSQRLHVPAQVFYGTATKVDHNIRKNTVVFLDRHVPQSQIVAAVERRIRQADLRAKFHEGYSMLDAINYATRREAVLSRYGEENDHYDRHQDTIFGQGNLCKRLLTCVGYFHTEPKMFEGGNLRVWHDNDKPETNVVEPKHNTAVFFPSWAYHAVEAVKVHPDAKWIDSRFSLNYWMGFNT